MAEVSEDKISRKARDLFDKGRASMDKRNYVYALQMFLGALTIEPGYTQARKFFIVVAITGFSEKNKNATAQQIAHITSTLFGLGGIVAVKGLIKKGQLKEALQKADQLMAKNPLNIMFIKLFCDAAEAAKYPEAAVLTLEAVTEYHPNNVNLLRRLAGFYRKLNRHKEAKDCMEKIVEMYPNDAQISREYKDLLAEESMAKGGWEEAAKGGSFRSTIKDIDEATALEQEAKTALAEGNLDKLIERAKEKIVKEPENLNYRRALSNLYLQANRFDEARDCLVEALRVTKTQDPQVEQAIATIRLKQFEHAIDEARKLGDEAGVKAREAEKHEFHYQELKKRVERYPNDLQLRFEFGEILVERGEMDQAIAQFQIAQRHPQRKLQSLYYMGVCFKEKGQFDMAMDQLQRAAAELPDMNNLKMTVIYELAQTLEALGKTEEALTHYKEIYQVDINFLDVGARIDAAYKATQGE